MGRRRRKNMKKKLRLHNKEVHHTHGGTFTRGTVSLADLLQHVHMADRPGQPWGDEETHQRWNDSAKTGHRQLFLKCQNCSLEFVFLTLRTEIEALEAYQPRHGQHGGLCAKVTCPECGEKSQAVLLGSRTVGEPIHTLKHHLVFGPAGCRISSARIGVGGMRFDSLLRHGGDGFDDLGGYFNSVILPDGVSVIVNGQAVGQRQPARTIPNIKLQTVTYDPQTERVRRHQRDTPVEIHEQHGETPMSDDYVGYMAEHDDAPPEIKNDRENAANLSEDAQKTLVQTITGAEPDQIVRRDPFDPDDMSESQELEHEGYTPINRGSLPAGVSEILKDAPTVGDTHDQRCKAHFRSDPNFPPETEHQRMCMAAFEEIASALIGKPIRCDRVRGGNVAAAYGNGIMKLNIDVGHIWSDPLGERTLRLLIHECSHGKVSGHAVAFREEGERMGARLARWVGDHHERWAALQEALYAPPAVEVGGAR